MSAIIIVFHYINALAVKLLQRSWRVCALLGTPSLPCHAPSWEAGSGQAVIANVQMTLDIPPLLPHLHLSDTTLHSFSVQG